MAKVLIIDDDRMWCKALGHLVAERGHQVDYAHSKQEGLDCTQAHSADVVMLDVGLPDGNGLDLIPHLRSMPPAPEVIIMTAAGNPDGAELAITNGAWDYFEKSASLKEMLLPLERAVQYRREKRAQPMPVSLVRDRIIGDSPSLKACLDQLAQAAVNDANVLIAGETGTGKELFARAIHDNSARAGQSFVVVDCAALPETLVESVLFGHSKGAFTGADHARQGLIAQADQGTLFLDEIGELPLELQKAFLRVLQDHRFRPLGAKQEIQSNFRLVAATHRDLEAMAERGRFRKDLLFRLRMLTLELPPLRKRGEDIKALALHYINKLGTGRGNETKGLAPDFMDLLCAYDWPGNVRELVNTLVSTLARAGLEPTIYGKHLPNHLRIQLARNTIGKPDPESCPQAPAPPTAKPAPQPMPSYKDFKQRLESQYIQDLLAHTQGDLKAAIQISKLSRSRFYALLKKKQSFHHLSYRPPAPHGVLQLGFHSSFQDSVPFIGQFFRLRFVPVTAEEYHN